MDDLAYWHEPNIPLIEQAARLHHRTVAIHPFLNGNGRWSRMLANLWLARHGFLVTAWPTDLERATGHRQASLQAVRKADDHDYTDLIALHMCWTD